MKLEAESMQGIDNPSWEQVKSVLTAMKSYGAVSFCSLTNKDGSYVQAAGGLYTCMIEYKNMQNGLHFRGYSDNPSTNFKEATKLVFGGGEILLSYDEWFDITQVIGVFHAFYSGEEFPSGILWRKISW